MNIYKWLVGHLNKDTQGNIILWMKLTFDNTYEQGELLEIIEKNSIYRLSDIHPKSQNLYLNMINKEIQRY